MELTYSQIYRRLPLDVALYIATYDDNPKKNMQCVLQELLEYHYMEWIEYNTPSGWAGRDEYQ